MEGNQNSGEVEAKNPNTTDRKACLVDEIEYKFTLPILNDGKTESYIKLSKTMLIVQGMDNRHKTCVKKLKEKYKQICALCPDPTSSSLSMLNRNLMENNVDERLQLRKHVRQKCQEGVNLVVINCLLNIDDMRYYFRLSKELGYVIVFEPWKLDRNAIQQFHGRATSSLLNGSLVNHLFFAWFLNERDSLAVRQESLMYFEDCVREVKEFELMMQRCQALSCPATYFQFGQKAIEQDLVYCAMKFCGSSYVSSDKAISQLTAKGVYGQAAKLKIVGFIISPYAIGAKVKLTFKQKELKDRQSNVDMCTCAERRSMFRKGGAHHLPDANNQACFSRCESTLETFVDKQYDPERIYTGRGQMAIMTLGYAKSKTPRDAAREMSDAVNRELDAMTKNVDVESWSIGKSSVRRYGKYWIINLGEMLSVDAMLSSEIVVK